MIYRLALTTLAGLLAQQALPGQEPVVQQVSLCVTTQIGPHGSYCEPFQCKPHYTTAAPGETVRIDIGGARAMPFVLFTGSSVTPCQPIHGITGALAVWAPITTLMIGTITDEGPRDAGLPADVWHPCDPGIFAMDMRVPEGVPLGLDVRFQVLGINEVGKFQQLEFSRAVELRIH